MRISTELIGRGHDVVRPSSTTSIVNGGPVLVRNGRVHVTPQRDGFVRPTELSFYYGFSAAGNPRTFAGIYFVGRTVLISAKAAAAPAWR